MSRSISKNFIYNFIRTLMGLIFPFITFTYTSRILGVEAIGQINFAKSIIQYFILISTLGITSYGIREGAKLRDDKSKLSIFTQEMLVINAVSTLIAYILLLLCYLTIAKFRDYAVLLSIFSVSIALNSMGMEWLYSALEDYKYIALRAVLFQFVSLILMFCFVKDADDVYIYTALLVLSSHGSYVCNFIHCHKFISLKKTRSYEIKKHLRHIFLLFAFTASVSIYTVLDSTMLGFLCNDKAVGLYTAGIKVNKLVQMLITSLGAVIMPRLSYYLEMKQKNKFSSLVENAYHFVLMMSFPICFGIFVLSKPAILLLSGSDFSDAVITSKLLVPIICLIPFSTLTNNQILIPLRKEKLILKSTCIGAVTNFIANMLLIPHYSENGAAVATVVAEAAVAIVCFRNAGKFCKIKKIILSCWKYPFAALPILFIGSKICSLDISVVNMIVFTVLIGFICYFVLLLILRDNFFIVQIKKVICLILKNKS